MLVRLEDVSTEGSFEQKVSISSVRSPQVHIERSAYHIGYGTRGCTFSGGIPSRKNKCLRPKSMREGKAEYMIVA